MKLRSGNKDSQSTIDFSEYLDGLYSYAVVLSRSRTEAEDLVQETCLRALRAMDRLRPDSNIKSWLFTILRNIWLNQLRRSRTVPEAFDEASEDRTNGSAHAPKDPYAIYVSNIELELVRQAIQQLPLEFREVILLREYEELSYEEIATLLDCPLGTVMSRLARARSRLRDLLTVVSPSPRKTAVGSKETSAWDPARDR
jgi:RNA polymerase sigma-70 factor, ECF subfamily